MYSRYHHRHSTVEYSHTMRYNVIQCDTVCCSVLQCDAAWCSMMKCDAVWWSGLHCVAVQCSVLQCVAVQCSVLQWDAVCCSMMQSTVKHRIMYISVYSYAIHTPTARGGSARHPKRTTWDREESKRDNQYRQYTNDSKSTTWTSPQIYLKPVERTLWNGAVPITKECVAVYS